MSTVCNCRQLKADGRRTSCCMQHTMWQPVALVVDSAYDKCRLSTKRNAQNFQPHTELLFAAIAKTKITHKNSPKRPTGKPGETCIDMIYYQSPYTILVVEILLRASLVANHLFNVCTIFHFNFRFTAFLFFHNSFDWKNWII